MNYKTVFRMPTPVKIVGRSSSITNSFINSIIPVIQPTSEEVQNALEILGMDFHSCRCAYCGDPASEWDHFRPLVKNQRPTGYISEIHNLVPSCGKCNQSKGNKDWLVWMESTARLSPKSRGVKDLRERIDKLKIYEARMQPTKLDFESIVGKEKWVQHWSNWEKVLKEMRYSQVLASEINSQIAMSYENRK